MERLSADRFEEWLAEHTAEPPPPAYRIGGDEGYSPSGAGIQAEELQRRGFEVISADPVVGSVGFVLPGDTIDAAMNYREDLLSACRDIDERDYLWVGEEARAEGLPGDEELPVVEVRSHLPEAGLPVLGPGGGVLLVGGGDRFNGSLTIRRRSGARESDRWREPSILRVPPWEYGNEVVLYGELGYFEASAREPQQVLRPVFMFVLEHEADPEREFDAGWRRLLVEPATEVSELPLSTGIELWHESEGVF